MPRLQGSKWEPLWRTKRVQQGRWEERPMLSYGHIRRDGKGLSAEAWNELEAAALVNVRLSQIDSRCDVSASESAIDRHYL